MDLFESAALKDDGTPDDLSAPLAVRLRPRTVEEVLGQDHLLKPGSPLRRLIEGSDAAPSSVFLWGPPGIGKTTLAYLVARAGGRKFVELSAVNAVVADVRRVIAEAKDLLVTDGTETVLFIDEVHRFTKTQQDALLPAVENRWVILVAATTENPAFSVISPLLSRSLLLTLQPLSNADVSTLLDRGLADERGFGGKLSLSDDARDQVIRMAGRDARRSLTILEASAGGVVDRGDTVITAKDVEEAADVHVVRYDRDGDEHYDVISAFIKSIRGSDVDAAIHYLAWMLEAGEDPRFVARRLMISAAEDVGMADPSALQTATAAAQSVALVGMPEARIILAEATVHLATAPKSNRAYLAINQAIEDVRAGRYGPVPMHLRDTNTAAYVKPAKGDEYKYAHDYPEGISPQKYLPAELEGTEYYKPTDRGYESNITPRLERARKILRRGK